MAEFESCDKCKYSTKMSDEFPCNTCKHGVNTEDFFKPKSNADRIRAMSDEELAEFIPVAFDIFCSPTKECLENYMVRGECTKTNKCALQWLKSEAKE